MARTWQPPDSNSYAPTEVHELYGKVFAPTRAEEVVRLITMLAREGVNAWRGQADGTQRIEPTLVRRWKISNHAGPADVPTEAVVRRLEQALLERARRAGHRSET